MPRYVEGFVIPLPKEKVAAYRRISRKAGKVWREHGAVEYVECIADETNEQNTPAFAKSVKAKPGEVVVFSWIVYKSRAHRDRVTTKVMSDPRLAGMMNNDAMPFDVKRMMYGGFKAIVEL